MWFVRRRRRLRDPTENDLSQQHISKSAPLLKRFNSWHVCLRNFRIAAAKVEPPSLSDSEAAVPRQRTMSSVNTPFRSVEPH